MVASMTGFGCHFAGACGDASWVHFTSAKTIQSPALGQVGSLKMIVLAVEIEPTILRLGSYRPERQRHGGSKTRT
jgi:hypothetical protein